MVQAGVESELCGLQHSSVLESTKQCLIMNMDRMLSESELAVKLGKINKLTRVGKESKTVVTKGVRDTYRLVLDSAVVGGEDQALVLAFRECRSALLDLLRDYARKGLIKLLVESFSDLKSVISGVRGQIGLVCFPMVNQVTGGLLLSSKTVEVVSAVRSSGKVARLYLDTSAGTGLVYEMLQEGHPFDFWSLDCNQMSGSEKSGLLMFKGSMYSGLMSSGLRKPVRKERLQSPQGGKAKKEGKQEGRSVGIEFAADSIMGVLNTLQVFQCNRAAKNQRLVLLREKVLGLLQKAGILLKVDTVKARQQVRKAERSGLQVVYYAEQDAVPTLMLFSLVKASKSGLQAVSSEVVIGRFEREQVKVAWIPVERLPVADEVFKTSFQVQMNDLTFNFALEQFVSALIGLHGY